MKMSSKFENCPGQPLPAGATVDVDRFPVHVDQNHHPLLIQPSPFPGENLRRENCCKAEPCCYPVLGCPPHI